MCAMSRVYKRECAYLQGTSLADAGRKATGGNSLQTLWPLGRCAMMATHSADNSKFRLEPKPYTAETLQTPDHNVDPCEGSHPCFLSSVWKWFNVLIANYFSIASPGQTGHILGKAKSDLTTTSHHRWWLVREAASKHWQGLLGESLGIILNYSQMPSAANYP